MFEVEPICRVLRNHNVLIAPSHLLPRYQPAAVGLSAVRRAPLASVSRVFYENFAVQNVWKMWPSLVADCDSMGRDQVARLMYLAALPGSDGRCRVRTTHRYPAASTSPDPVRCDIEFCGVFGPISLTSV